MSRDVLLDDQANELKRLKKLEKRKRREAKEKAKLEAETSRKSEDESLEQQTESGEPKHNELSDVDNSPKIISFDDSKVDGDEAPEIKRNYNALVEVAITEAEAANSSLTIGETLLESLDVPADLRDDSSSLSSSASSPKKKRTKLPQSKVAGSLPSLKNKDVHENSPLLSDTQSNLPSSNTHASNSNSSLGPAAAEHDGVNSRIVPAVKLSDLPDASEAPLVSLDNFLPEFLEAEYTHICSQINALSVYKDKLEAWLGPNKTRPRLIGRARRQNPEPAILIGGSATPPSTPKLQYSFSRFWSLIRKKGNVTRKEAGEQWKNLKAAGKDKEFFQSEDALQLQNQVEGAEGLNQENENDLN